MVFAAAHMWVVCTTVYLVYIYNLCVSKNMLVTTGERENENGTHGMGRRSARVGGLVGLCFETPCDLMVLVRGPSVRLMRVESIILVH